MKPAEAYILNQEEPYRDILLYIQQIIALTLPEITLKYKWNIPCFYIGKKPICYFNVNKKKGFVDVAFWHASCIKKHRAHLVSENRKVVKSLRYNTINAVDQTVLISILKDIEGCNKTGFLK